MAGRITVINPNSNTAVTAAIDQALACFRHADGPEIECVTLHDGPCGIEWQRDSDIAATLVARYVAAQADRTDAFVIACYSDPGVQAAREVTRKPVFGCAETALTTALAMGGRPGVISILEVAVRRHWDHARKLSLDRLVAADIPIGLPVADLADVSRTRPRMIAAGRRLRDEYGADFIVLGCAGMARYREALEADLDMTVIDPTQAAVGAAITALRLGYRGYAPGAGGPVDET